MADPFVSHQGAGEGTTSLVLEASSSLLRTSEVVSPAFRVSHASVNARLESSHGSPGVLVVVSEDTSSSVEASASGSDLSEGMVSPLLDVVSSVLDEVVDSVLEGLRKSVEVTDVSLNTSSSASSVPESAGPVSSGVVVAAGSPVLSSVVSMVSSMLEVAVSGAPVALGGTGVSLGMFVVVSGSGSGFLVDLF